MISISIVTPWYDHLELCDDYFEAVLPELEDADENIIVDNGSDPPLAFAKYRPFENLGFCGGCNIGLDMSDRDAVVFLNNDIALKRRGWLNEIREALERDVLVGNLRFDRHSSVDEQAFPYIDGWCLAGMRDDLLALGGFDTKLQEPAYYSDNMLCLEARAMGMTLRDVSVGLVHKLNATAGSAHDERVRAATEVNRSRYEARVRELLAVA